jgi:hypothetical protein
VYGLVQRYYARIFLESLEVSRTLYKKARSNFLSKLVFMLTI